MSDSVIPSIQETASLLARTAALEALPGLLARLAASPTTAPAAALPEYLTTAQAAAMLGMSRKGLEQLRARGGGPPFVRVGKAVRYPRGTLGEVRQ